MITLLALSLVHQVARQPIDFSWFGCNRVSDAVEKAQFDVNKSSANIAELKANFRDIAATESTLVFAVGDLVNGYADDQGEHLKMQLNAWPELVTLKPGASLIPTTGNHEMNRKHKKMKLSSNFTEPVWIDWIKQNHYDKFAGNGPTPTSDPDDQLATDQSLLNYSFTVGSTHFICLNTDTRTTATMPDVPTEPRVGWIPAKWVAQDIAKAESDDQVKDIFVLGHRNLVDPLDSKEDAPMDRDCAATVLGAFKSSTKIRAFLCAHVHAYDFQKIPGTGAYQIVIGNGGSDLNKEWNPPSGTWFGFGEIKIHEDGKVGLILHKRPVPAETRPVNESAPPSIAETERFL